MQREDHLLRKARVKTQQFTYLDLTHICIPCPGLDHIPELWAQVSIRKKKA